MSMVDEMIVDPLKEFYMQSVSLVKKCKKPQTKEFLEIARATGQGFLVVGFIGFFVKIVHIPINHIIMTM